MEKREYVLVFIFFLLYKKNNKSTADYENEGSRECIYNKHLVWIWKPASEGRYDSALGVLLL